MKKKLLLAAGVLFAALGGLVMFGMGLFSAKAEERLKVGDPAPAVSVKLDDGTTLEIAKEKRPLVVYFYPKDDTPGCTKEACTFRDKETDLKKSGALVVGISFDDAESHQAFRKKYKIPFALGTDPDGSVAEAFGVSVRGLGPIKFHARDTIVIGADNRIRAVLRGVDPVDSVDEVLAALAAPAAPKK